MGGEIDGEVLRRFEALTGEEVLRLDREFGAIAKLIRRKVRDEARDALKRDEWFIRGKVKGDSMRILAKLAALNTDRSDLGELVELAVETQAVKEGFEQFDIPVPEAILDGLDTLRTEISTRKADAIKKRLRELAAMDAQDKTTTERRDDRAKERERLEAQLGIKKDAQPV